MQSWLGLRSRLVLLVLLALLPVFGLFAYSAAQSRKAALQLVESNLQSQVLLVAAHQQRLVEIVDELLDGIVSGPYITNPAPGECALLLKKLLAGHPEIISLGVAGLDGKLICNAPESAHDNLVLHQASINQVRAGQHFAVGHYAIGQSSGLPGLGFAMPMYTTAGELGAMAYAVVSLPGLGAPLTNVPTLPGTSLAVMDRDGTVLAAYPLAPSQLGKPYPDVAVQQAVKLRQQSVRQATDSEAIRRIYAFSPVPGGGDDGLFVVVSVPQELALAANRNTVGIELLALLAMALLGVVSASCMGKRLIVNPAKAILKEACEVTRGNLAARVKLGPRSYGEIDEIGLAFNRMAETLQARRAELDAALRYTDKERALLDLILNSMSEGVIAVDAEDSFLLFNAGASTLFSKPEADLSFDGWRRKNGLLKLDGTTLDRDAGPLTQTLQGASIDNWDLMLNRPGAENRVLRISTRPLRDVNNLQVGGVLVFNDITELKAAEGFAQAQEQVLALIAAGSPLHKSLDAVARLVEKSSPGSLCSILVVEGQQLRHGAAPSLPESFTNAIDGFQINAGVGAYSAAFLKEQLVIEDAGQDPLMLNYRDLLLAHKLQAFWSAPVISTCGKVLATFAIYRRTPCKPDVKDMELITAATRLARLALERTHAEAVLTSSEARFRELAENIEDVFYNVDVVTGQILYVSPGYQKICGRSCESLYTNPKSYIDAVVPEDRPLLKRASERNTAGKISAVEYRILALDGRLRWIRDHAYPVFNSDGKPERVVGTARDITDSKLAELALASTNRALQMLSRSSIAINRIDDEAGLLAEVCRVAVDVGSYRMAWVGYALDDAAQSIQPMAHAGKEDGYLASIALSWRDGSVIGQGPSGRSIRSGQPEYRSDISRSDNFYWRDAALERGYLSSISLPLRDGQRSFGVLCLYSAVVEHFTSDEVKLLQELADNLAFGIGNLRARLERQRSEAAARQAAAQLREQASLLDRAQDAIFVRNLDSTLRFWNKGAERLYGWTAEEVQGRTMAELMYLNPQLLIAAMDQTLANDGDWTGELEQVARDGSPVSIEARWTVVRDDQGLANGVLGINTDIRERKRAREEILLLNASLEERVQQRTVQLKFANQQLEAFSYSVSHDLRSPLSVIDGFSDLLEKSMAKTSNDPLTDRCQHYLSRIRAGASQMGELIDALLSLAQVSRSSLRWEPVDLSALAERWLANAQERQPGRPTQWHVEAGLTAQGDSRLLQQVLDNLLSNAWKFSAGEARTEITFGHESNRAGETIYFIRDNGAGFDMAYAKKLFGAFQRLHSQSEFAGTGIGLATVHQIIVRHGGRVWGESSVGRGATFYFTLGTAMPQDA
ncbi:MAG: PAS domain S-box protein [Polaromonas sp.]|uniref:PAS domain S-box protein n=1 Tax=Polaromonas sp. TaxID=1869339 RepID=UPI00182FA562|nr:PAS domain S-box protein [Polaromonas sp.]NMM11287.1 PAS domain S-box protein [Polaromonas sp.]